MKRLFWVYLFGIVLLLALPVNTPGNQYDLNDITVVSLRGDYFFHMLTFVPWVFFGSAMGKKLWLWMILGLLFAFVTELLQLALPWRAFNINDLIANGCGISYGYPVILLFNYFRKKLYLAN